MAASSSGGFCYSDVSSGGNPTLATHVVNQIQGFVSDSDMFNLATGMDMIGFSKNLHQHTDWKTSFLPKPPHNPPPSSSTNFYQHDFHKPDFTSGISETSLVGPHDWQHNRLLVDDSSLRCAFPFEPNERPSQGLSLSLSSANPSGIQLQSFELRQHNNNNHHHQEEFVSSSSREGFLGKSPDTHHQMLQDGYLGKAANVYQGHFLLKNSKYLVPAQQLLNEFCSLGTKQSEILKQKSQKNKQLEEDNGSGPSKKHRLTSLEFVELQKRKTKLLSMLEEVERRYRHYCNQMKAVVSSFEAVAGHGAATVYSALALKAMSRHFKCLKDGIMGQLQDTRKAMGEKDTVAPGLARGETPKLRIIDQALRQQRAFQQMGMMESHPWRPQRGLPERSVSLLRAWLFEHFLNPYPSDADKHILARQTGLSRSQVSNWFINARVRLWKPMVEEMYLEEVKEQEQESNRACSEGDNSRNVEKPPPTDLQDQKHIPDGVAGMESKCVSTMSSIMNNPKSTTKTLQNHRIGEEQCMGTFGSMELDFSAYTSHSGGMVSLSNENNRGRDVSLTLGLQQDGGNGVSLAFPAASTHQSSLLYSKDQIDDCQPVQYSLLDAQPQNLPYTHLMASHLLHDLAG